MSENSTKSTYIIGLQTVLLGGEKAELFRQYTYIIVYKIPKRKLRRTLTFSAAPIYNSIRKAIRRAVRRAEGFAAFSKEKYGDSSAFLPVLSFDSFL